MAKVVNGLKKEVITKDEFKIIMIEQAMEKINDDMLEVYSRLDSISSLLRYSICAVIAIYLIDTASSLFYIFG